MASVIHGPQVTALLSEKSDEDNRAPRADYVQGSTRPCLGGSDVVVMGC